MSLRDFDYVVLGAGGHVGSAVLENLDDGARVLAVVHNPEKGRSLSGKRVEPVVVDVADTAALGSVFRNARRAFLLNPPALPTTDTDAEELGTARSIASALQGSGLEKVVLASTYGAQPGDGIGDLSVLHEFEQLVEATGIPAAINRGPYYFTNLDMLVEQARRGGIRTAFPAGMEIPMVAPSDLGRAAAARLTSGLDDLGIRYVEGPRRYSFIDVGAAFSDALGNVVTVEEIPRGQIEASFRQAGFSPPAARSFTRMTEMSIDGGFQLPADPQRGVVTLEDYVRSLV